MRFYILDKESILDSLTGICEFQEVNDFVDMVCRHDDCTLYYNNEEKWIPFAPHSLNMSIKGLIEQIGEDYCLIPDAQLKKILESTDINVLMDSDLWEVDYNNIDEGYLEVSEVKKEEPVADKEFKDLLFIRRVQGDDVFEVSTRNPEEFVESFIKYLNKCEPDFAQKYIKKLYQSDTIASLFNVLFG